MNEPLLEIKGLSRYYNPGKANEVEVFHDLDLFISEPSVIAIMGESGSGKSTLLNILGMLDDPTEGDVYFSGKERRSFQDRPRFRNEKIGFVFQNHLLLEDFSALDNVAMPLFIRDPDRKSCREKAADLLDKVGLSSRSGHRPGELSGGENQRVAIARALITEPDLVLADEPTGNLDFRNQDRVGDLLLDMARQMDRTVLIATHSNEIAGKCASIYRFQEGKLEKIK